MTRTAPIRLLLRVVVALTVTLAGVAFAPGVAGAQNGVAAINVEIGSLVAAGQHISAGHVGDRTLLFDDVASGGCVAPQTPPSSLPNDALVVRGGANITPESISNGTGVHPCGIEGFSAESRASASLSELAPWVPNNQIGVTTVGEVRAAGGEVTPTSGRSPNHATVSGLDPALASALFSPSQPNPVPKDQREVFR